MNRILLWTITTLLILSCAQSKRPKGVSIDDLRNQIATQQFKAKGADIFCDQASYLECYQIDRNQCLSQMRPFNSQCFDFAIAKAGKYIPDNEKFFEYFSRCMTNQHLTFHGDENFREIAACLNNLQLDREQFRKTMDPSLIQLLTIFDEDMTLEKLRRDGKK